MFYCGDYPSSQVFRVAIHATMLSLVHSRRNVLKGHTRRRGGPLRELLPTKIPVYAFFARLYCDVSSR